MQPLLTLNLYDADNEIVKTLERAVVPWNVLKKAVALGGELEAIDDPIAQVEKVFDLIVLVFAEKVTREELEAGADLGDMLNVLSQVMARVRAGNALGAKTPPKRKK